MPYFATLIDSLRACGMAKGITGYAYEYGPEGFAEWGTRTGPVLSHEELSREAEKASLANLAINSRSSGATGERVAALSK